jgi:exopolysaccharide production protein ExoQ
MALMFPLALFAPKGMVPLLILTTLLVAGLSYNGILNFLSAIPKNLGFSIVAFIGFAALSSIWSVAAGTTLYSAFILALESLGGLIIIVVANQLNSDQRKFVEKAAIIGGSIGLALTLFEYQSHGFLKQSVVELFSVKIRPEKAFDPALNPGVAVFVLFVWPWAIAIKNRMGTLFLSLILFVFILAIAMGRADTPALALVLGLLAAISTLLPIKLISRVFIVIVITMIAAMPFIPGSLPHPETETERLRFLPPSALHRLSIWNTAAERLKERPILGFGMNTTRSLYGNSDRITREYFANDLSKKWVNIFEPIPLHAHNGILQIWLELGIGGALLLGAIILSLIRLMCENSSTRSSNRYWLSAGFGLMTSSLVIFSLSYGPWQSWWQSTIWLSACFLVAVRNPNGDAV